MLTNILDYLKHSTEKYGDKTAFSDSADSVTYRGLDVLSDSIASFLMTEIPGKKGSRREAAPPRLRGLPGMAMPPAGGPASLICLLLPICRGWVLSIFPI